MSRSVWLAERLSLPPSVKAILFDMDGVLIDSITLDYNICNDLVRGFIDFDANITRELIRKGFALSAPDFWWWLLEEIAVSFSQSQFHALLSEYEDARRTSSYALNPGISDILEDAAKRGLKMAVVSNNPTGDVATILDKAGILSRFDIINGNDQKALRKKPSPDTYLNAAQRMAVDIAECAIVEDSILGIEAGLRSGAYSIGVATGGDTFEELLASRKAHVCYRSFLPRKIDLELSDVLVKRIVTPNEFVSHMIEHIAWRLGVAIDLAWHNSDWVALGTELGREIARIGYRVDSTSVIGMIDDGSAEVRLRVRTGGHVNFEAVGDVSLDHFLSLRCEQLGSGAPLRELIEGLVTGLGADLTVRICSLEDPHHTWEGVFRAIGIALNRVCRPTPDSAPYVDLRRSLPSPKAAGLENVGHGAGSLRVLALSTTACELARETAESLVSAKVRISDSPSCVAEITVSSTINVSAFATLMATFAKTAGLEISIQFSATKISSSHVVLEDTALVIGTALFKIMEARMHYLGINGAGSSLSSYEEFQSSAVTAAVSLEGRKFFKMVPFDMSYRDFRRKFILGQNAWETLRSEDIDDFLDALAGGMRASIVVHFRDCRASDSELAWRSAIAAIGTAIREAVAVNPALRGLPPGVKATLI